MADFPQICRVVPAMDGNLKLETLLSNAPDGVLRATYTAAAICRTDAVYLAAYARDGDQVDFYRLTDTSPWIAYVSSAKVGAGWDKLESFTLGNVVHLMAYESKGGRFEFFPLDAQLRVRPSYRLSRSHAPGASKGFSTVKPFVLDGGIVLLAYAFDAGAVAMYRVTVTASSPADAAPLRAIPIWDHQWAKGWTRFAFFQLGGENFFLKTNTLYPNVNIDHILDDPATGTSEVATQMTLVDADKLTLVESFTVGAEDIVHFYACRGDGATVLYRFRSDCQGWSRAGSAALPASASMLVPYRLGQDSFVLVM